MKTIFIQDVDIKSINWSRYLPNYKVKCVPVGKDRIFLLFSILWYSITGHKPHAVIFRYLNDYQSLIKTLARVVAEIIIFLVCSFFGIKLIWICHNIDIATTKHHAFLANFRKRLLLNCASKILFTHKDLVKKGQETMGVDAERSGWTCFGEISTNTLSSSRYSSKINHFSERVKKSGKEFVGIWPGNLENKNINSLKLSINIAKNVSKVGMLIVGNLRYLSKEDLDELGNIEDLLVIDDFVNINCNGLLREVDFFVKGTNDLSIPFTLFHSMSAHKPIIVPSRSYVSKIVHKYEIGTSLDSENPNSAKLLKKVRDWDKERANKFLALYNWDVGASNIANNL